MINENNHNDRFEELCTGYVLDALEPNERAEFERMLEQAEEDQIQLYHKLQSTANHLALGAEKTDPPESVKEQLMRVIEEDLEESESPEGIKTNSVSSGEYDKATLAIAASFALLIVTLTLIFYSFNLSGQLQQKNETIEQQHEQITELKFEIDQKNKLLAILESREVDLVVMRGMEASPNGYGKIIWNSENQQALLQVSNLPAVPSDKEYQLWIIKDNQPISAGMFAVHDPKRDAFFRIEQMVSGDEQSTSAFAVTLEPKGGVPQPTGDMYLMGKMGE